MVLRKTNEAIVLPYCAFLFCWFSGIYERGKTQQHQSRQRQMYAGERLFQTCLVYRVKEDMKTRNDNVSQEEISIMTFWLIEINGFLQKYSVTSMAVFAIERIDGRGSRATVESYISKVIRIFFFFCFGRDSIEKIVIANKGSTVASNQFETMKKKEFSQELRNCTYQL